MKAGESLFDHDAEWKIGAEQIRSWRIEGKLRSAKRREIAQRLDVAETLDWARERKKRMDAERDELQRHKDESRSVYEWAKANSADMARIAKRFGGVK